MTDKEKVSKVVDRLYYHEFMMNELDATVEEYSTNCSGYNWGADEFKGKLDEVKDILNKRLMKDLKEILNMC